MKSLKAFSPVLLWLAAPAMANNHVPPPVQPATSFAAVDVHKDEKVAVAAEPYDTLKKEAIFHGDYFGYGVIPIRVIVTNNSDEPISLLEMRIILITAAGNSVKVAEPAEVERVMNSKGREGGKTPKHSAKPMPRPSKQDVDDDFDTFEFRALTVEPHTTRAGFVFYAVSGLDHPLEGAKLSVVALRDANGTELFEFEIPFDKYLKSNESH